MWSLLPSLSLAAPLGPAASALLGPPGPPIAREAAPARPCATMDLLPHAAPLSRAAPSLRGVGLQLRDPYGLPNTAIGAHFAVHWGNSGGIDQGDIDRLLQTFELAWSIQVDEMGHPPPLTTDGWYFNVYIGDSGDGAPSGYGAGGYYWTDVQGFPMIVIAAGSFFDPDFADHAASHEFYHAIQGSTYRYAYDGISAWYWEATAEWAALETEPLNPYNGPFVAGYLMLPHLPVDFFDYPDTGILEEYHQYGAFLFPHDLTEQYGIELVRDSWALPGPEGDPLEVLREGLAAEGADLDELWLDHLARNAVFDYAGGDLYEATTTAWEGYFPSERVAAVVRRDGGAGRIDGPDAPYRYGGVNVALEDPSPGTLEVRITGDAEGDQGSRGRYGARVVRQRRDGSLEYLDVPFEGDVGALDVPDVGAEDTIWLTVGAWTPGDQRWDTERFGLEWSLAVVEPAVTTPTEPIDPTDPGDPSDPGGDPDDPAVRTGGCGCASGSPAPWAVGPLGLLLLTLRRRP